MHNTEMLIDRLRALPTETEYVEFKKDFSEPQKEGEDICALANAAAYCGVTAAYKIWGIDDATHDVVGTNFKPRKKKKGNQDLEIWLRQQLSDNANFEFEESIYNGVPVVVLKVWPALHHPVKFGDKVYIRTGSSTQKLRSGSTRESELWKRIQQDVFETQAALEDIDADEILNLLDCDRYFDLLGVPRPNTSAGIIHYFIEEEMVRQQDDGLYTVNNLGALLFARDISAFRTVRRKALRVIEYDGKGRAANRREREFTRGYALDLDEAYGYINMLLPATETVDGMRRVGVSPYPEVSLRELIVNSLIHQDFAVTGAGPMVELFDTRIEVTNPGAPLVDIERIVNDPPKSRNERLSALMRRFSYCEEAGSGWDKIIEGCERYHLPAPRIETHGDQSMRVSLYQAKEFKYLTLDEKLHICYWHACACYENGEYVTNASLRERFDIKSSNSAQVSRLIKTAIEAKLVKAVDPTTSPRYMKYEPYWA